MGTVPLATASQSMERRSSTPPSSIPSQHGWVHLDDLGGMRRLPERRIDMDVFRGRRQLGKAGILGAAGIVERRPDRRTLRFGTDRVEVGRL